MSFLSLEKYLYGPYRTPASAPPVPAGPRTDGYFGLCGVMLGSLSRSMVAGEALADIRNDLNTLTEGLHPDADSESLAAVARKFDGLLRTFRDRLREADEQRASDFRQILASLNEAFSYLNAGGEKADVRLKTVETSLRASLQMENIGKLKSVLSDVLVSVKEAADEARKENQQAIQSLEHQLVQAQRSASSYRVGLRDREEAISTLGAWLERPDQSSRIVVGIFIAGSLDAIRTRHGNSFSEEMMERLGREHIQPLLSGSRVFSWASNSLVTLWEGEESIDVLTHRVRNAIVGPLELRATVGTRCATFRIPVRSLLMEGHGGRDEIVKRLDRFGQEQ